MTVSVPVTHINGELLGESAPSIEDQVGTDEEVYPDVDYDSVLNFLDVLMDAQLHNVNIDGKREFVSRFGNSMVDLGEDSPFQVGMNLVVCYTLAQVLEADLVIHEGVSSMMGIPLQSVQGMFEKWISMVRAHKSGVNVYTQETYEEFKKDYDDLKITAESFTATVEELSEFVFTQTMGQIGDYFEMEMSHISDRLYYQSANTRALVDEIFGPRFDAIMKKHMKHYVDRTKTLIDAKIANLVVDMGAIDEKFKRILAPNTGVLFDIKDGGSNKDEKKTEVGTV